MKLIIHISPHRRGTLLLVLGALFTALSFTACKLETSDNGQLDGYWKLDRVDTLATGGVLDLSERSIFWSVQMHLISVKDKDQPRSREILFRFDHSGNQLTLSEPMEGIQYAGDLPIDDPELLKPFGINQLTESFTIEAIHNRRMYLSTSQMRLSFTRF